MKARDAAPSLSPSMGEVLGRRLRRLPLSRRAARVDLSQKGEVGCIRNARTHREGEGRRADAQKHAIPL